MEKRLPTKTTIGATEARNHFGEFLKRVHSGEEHLVIEKMGIPVAAIISVGDYQYYRRLLASEMLRKLGRSVGAEAEAQGLTEEKLLELMEEDRQTVYRKMYGQGS